MIAPKDGFLQTMHTRKIMQIMHFMQPASGRENGLPFFLRGEYSGGGCLKLKANPYTGATEGEAKGMEHIRKFLRGKGFALALLACIAAAAAAGVWAVGAIRDQMARDLGESPSQNITGEETFPGIDQGAGPETEEQLWEQEAASAAQPAADVPESSSSGGPSGAPSGSGSVSEPSALQTESPAASASAGSGYTRPVSGQVLAVWSGDELVYQETLGDWRTHNGVDYACKPGEDVLAPVSGTVESLAAEGNWGVVAAIRDGEGRLWRLSALEDAAVRQGDAVAAGQKLGRAGVITGESAQDPHIHLEVLDGDQYLDPVKLIGS